MAAMVCLATALTPSMTAAQPAEKIVLQLNEAASVGGSCRLTFVIRNELPDTVTALGLDLVMFDTSGGVSGYAAVDFGALPAGKTRVRQYDVAKGDCADLSRVLLNDIRACEIEARADRECLSMLALSSRSEIDLVL